MTRCINIVSVPQDILQWFDSVFNHYLSWNKIGPNQRSINSIWVNEMKANEYNPVHIHQGKLIYWFIFCNGFKIT
jgi:hypothetical protein